MQTLAQHCTMRAAAAKGAPLCAHRTAAVPRVGRAQRLLCRAEQQQQQQTTESSGAAPALRILIL
jgi:hypothetical protein